MPVNLLKLPFLEILARNYAIGALRNSAGDFVNNDACVSQGIPLSARLFAIYDDYSMAIYTNGLRNAKVSTIQNTIRGGAAEHERAEYILKLKPKAPWNYSNLALWAYLLLKKI